MSETIGFVQTRGIGDLIIALPAAAHHLKQGRRVLWPVDQRFLPAFQAAAPAIEFLPVLSPASQAQAYFLDEPLHLLKQQGCADIRILYSYLGKPLNERLYASLKFDEYKYAVAGVPFREKWKLQIERNPAREIALYESLGIRKDFICVHREGSNFSIAVELPEALREAFDIIEVQAITDNPFDWLYTLERAAELIMVDSCFANLVEQLNLPNPKRLILRSAVPFTPVFKNGWSFA